MSPRYDIQIGNDNDLILQNGDLVWDISDQQHVQDTINAYPGWWKENFSDGVAALSFINSSGQEQVIARIVKLQLESDLYEVNNPIIKFDSNGNLTIQPNAS